MSGNITLDWAAYYAGQGLRVFPIKPGQKSPPLITDWPKLATSDATTISAWWGWSPDANVGVVMGAGLVDIETDVKPDANGEESLAKWVAGSRITLPPTWSFKSGSGGIHRIFRCEGDMPNRVGILPAVDIRGGSGYAVFPPSLHPSGNYYEWLPGCSPADLPGGPAPVPPELFFLLRDDSKAPLEVPAEVIEGSRNDTLFRLACKLRRVGLEEDEMFDALLTVNGNRCIPPLETSEVETICRQAAQYKAGPLPDAAAYSGVIGAAELMEKEFRPLVQPVHGLISEGLTLLVAASKMGKSWMALLMALCVATGEDFLGRHTTRCRVLYMALEDSERRLQDRLRKLCSGQVPENLYLKTCAPLMGDGFEEYLESWLSEDNTPALVIVDTLQKIRGLGSRNVDAYKADYETMGKLKAIADKHRASLVCLHHNNKMQRVADPFDKISGSSAMMGAADTAILISRDRGQDTATVIFTGRDVHGEDFTIRFDGGRWLLVSDNAREYQAAQEYESDPLAQIICILAKENPEGGRWTYAELGEAGIEKIGVEPFASGKECGKRLMDGLATELWKRDNIRVKWGIHTSKGNCVELKLAV